MKTPPVQTTNYEKFQTGNPIVRRLIGNFYNQIIQEVAAISPSSVLDAGCGEGETLDRLQEILPDQAYGFDLNAQSIAFARQRIPQVKFSVQDITNIEFPDDKFDVVLCLEVLEHLVEPEAALNELLRVTKRDVLLSVPHEPWFRLGSLARGKHLSRIGNHPEHIQQWNPSSFQRFIAQQAEVRTVQRSFPWIILHAQKKKTT